MNISCTNILNHSKLKISPLSFEMWMNKQTGLHYPWDIISSTLDLAIDKENYMTKFEGLTFKKEAFKRPYKNKSIYSTFSNKLTFRENNFNPEVLQGGGGNCLQKKRGRESLLLLRGSSSTTIFICQNSYTCTK